MTLRAPVLGFVLCSTLLAACADETAATNDTRGDDARADSAQVPNAASPSSTTTTTTSSAGSSNGAATPAAPSAPKLEVGAYYAGYTTTTLPQDDLDFTLVDDVIHFAVIPLADGGLDDATNVLDLAKSLDLTQKAKAAGKHATLCIGGAGSGAAFAIAARDNRSTLVSNIVSYVAARGYAGVDIDWEPLAPADASSFVSLANDLRAALPAGTSISAAIPVGSGALVAPALASLDRIHLMSYDLSGPYQGWVTWHNGALYDGGATFPSTGGKLPSVSAAIDDLLAAGIPASKVMLGIDHQGYAWKGGAAADGTPLVAPQMTWSVPPTMTPIPYSRIADSLLTPARAKWDGVAKVPFLSIDEAGTSDDQFITYEDEHSQREKVQYARAKGLAGVFVWDIAAGYRPSLPPGDSLGLMKSLHADAQAAE